MKQERLNHLVIMYLHKEREIDIGAAITEFIQCKPACRVILDLLGE